MTKKVTKLLKHLRLLMQTCKIDPLFFDTLDKSFVIFPPHLLLEHLSVCVRVQVLCVRTKTK